MIVESDAGFNLTIYSYSVAIMYGSAKLNAIKTAYHGERIFVNRLPFTFLLNLLYDVASCFYC